MTSIINGLFSILSKTILFVIGWASVNKNTFKRLNSYPRTILVFSHTTYCDFFIMILYKLAYPDELQHLKTLVKPQPFEYAGWLLHKIGAIPATKVEDKNGGAVNRIVNELKEFDKFIFLISPKGTIVKREWRSGYYHIGKELNAVFRTAGLDYEKKCVIISEEAQNDNDEEAVKEFLQDKLQQIVPLFPEEEIVDIRQHDESKRTVLNVERIIGTFAIISIIGIYVFLI